MRFRRAPVSPTPLGGRRAAALTSDPEVVIDLQEPTYEFQGLLPGNSMLEGKHLQGLPVHLGPMETEKLLLILLCRTGDQQPLLFDDGSFQGPLKARF
jgi:hypothetical protein